MNPQRALSGVVRSGLLGGQTKGAGEASARKDACRALLAFFRSQRVHGAVLFTPDNALWGFIKERVSKMRYRTTEVIWAAVEEAFAYVTPDYVRKTSARTWRRIQLCYDNEGLYTDVLNS
jgi:hypothetical protein